MARSSMERATLGQDVRVLLGPLTYDCQVQVVIPSGVTVFLAIDCDVASRGHELQPAKGAGPGSARTYKMPPFDGDQTVSFPMGRGQWLVGAVEQGMAHVALILSEEG